MDPYYGLCEEIRDILENFDENETNVKKYMGSDDRIEAEKLLDLKNHVESLIGQECDHVFDFILNRFHVHKTIAIYTFDQVKKGFHTWAKLEQETLDERDGGGALFTLTQPDNTFTQEEAMQSMEMDQYYSNDEAAVDAER